MSEKTLAENFLLEWELPQLLEVFTYLYLFSCGKGKIKLTEQPVVAIIGDSLFEIEASFVVVNNIKYALDTLL